MNVVVEQVAPHVSTILLNRPGRLDSVSFDLAGDLHDALDAVAADDDCKVAILTGAGRASYAGLDLEDRARSRTRSAAAPHRRARPVEITRVYSLESFQEVEQWARTRSR